MKKIDLLNIDLKLLLIFKAVFEEGSVTRAAARLDISQSLASHALDRLRSAFNDPLFVRSGKTITPTLRAEALAPKLFEIAQQLEALAEPEYLDKESLETEFILSANDFERRLIAPSVLAYLLEEAPKTSLNLINTKEHFADSLRLRECDVVITPRKPPNSFDFYSQPLFEDRFICYFDPAILSKQEVQEKYVNLRHARVQFVGDGSNVIDTLLKSKGLQRDVKLVTPSFEALPELIKGTDLVATLPARLASALFKGFEATEFPLNSPIMTFQMIWHHSTHHSLSHKWFRELIHKSLKSDSMMPT